MQKTANMLFVDKATMYLKRSIKNSSFNAVDDYYYHLCIDYDWIRPYKSFEVKKGFDLNLENFEKKS